MVLLLLWACGDDEGPRPVSDVTDTQAEPTDSTPALVDTAVDATDAEDGAADDSGEDTVADTTPIDPNLFVYDVPLDPYSPWPRFRRTALQDGRSPISGEDTGAPYWVFQTQKGIFSTPVIDGDGTVYVGSADRHMYAINLDGSLKWSFVTDEIIDSSALLDDQGRIYFGSGDGMLYALDRANAEGSQVVASIDGSSLQLAEHNIAILLIDAVSGTPLPLNYPEDTQHMTADDGTILSVSITFADGDINGDVWAYLMVDTYPTASQYLIF